MKCEKCHKIFARIDTKEDERVIECPHCGSVIWKKWLDEHEPKKQ